MSISKNIIKVWVHNMKKENHSIFKALTMISQVGITFLTPIGLCVLAGYYLDKYFNKNFWVIVLFFLGVLAAFRNVYYLTKSFYEKDLKQENKELEYWKHFTKEDKPADANGKNGKDTDKE